MCSGIGIQRSDMRRRVEASACCLTLSLATRLFPAAESVCDRQFCWHIFASSLRTIDPHVQ